MKKQIYFFIILLVVLQIPFLILSIAGHELIHKYDYRNIEKTNESFCFGSCGEGFGHYTFIPNEEQREEAMKIHQTTEIRAWTFTISILVLYLVIIIYLMIKFVKGGVEWKMKQ